MDLVSVGGLAVRGVHPLQPPRGGGGRGRETMSLCRQIDSLFMSGSLVRRDVLLHYLYF